MKQLNALLLAKNVSIKGMPLWYEKKNKRLIL